MANMLSNLVGGLSSVAGTRVVDDFFGPGAARIMRGWYFQGREAEAVTQRVGGLANVVTEGNRNKILLFRAVRTMSGQLTRTETLTDQMAQTVAGIQSLGVARVDKENPLPAAPADGGIVGGGGSVDLGSIGGISGVVKNIMQGWGISRGLSIVGTVAGFVTSALGRVAAAAIVALPQLIPIIALAAVGLAIGTMIYLGYQQLTGNLQGAATSKEIYEKEKQEGKWTDDKLIEFNRGRVASGGSMPEHMRADVEQAYRNKNIPMPVTSADTPRLYGNGAVESSTPPASDTDSARDTLSQNAPTAEEKEAMITKLMETPGISESRTREEFRVLLENPEVMNNPEMKKVLEKVREEKRQQPRPEQQGSIDSLRGGDLNLASIAVKEQSEKLKNPTILPRQSGSTSVPAMTAMNQPVSPGRAGAEEKPTIDFGKTLAEKFGLPVKTASNRIGLREQWVS